MIPVDLLAVAELCAALLMVSLTLVVCGVMVSGEEREEKWTGSARG